MTTHRGTSKKGPSLLGELDLHLFNEGTHTRLYEKLGAHPGKVAGADGTHFAVWAPAARAVDVIGDFNRWQPGAHPLQPLGGSGIWAAFVPGVGPGQIYKYRVAPRAELPAAEKTDPFGFLQEVPPRTASVVHDLGYAWGDAAWMASRGRRTSRDAPVSIYEVHLGSWRRPGDDPERFLTYRELAPLLVDHVREAGFTHVEFLPVMEHPYYPSWGYQTTGYFAPTSRYGSPQDFMALIDRLHQAEIGVILDWVPSHFPTDGHGLASFDGTCLYEHADPRQGYHPDWKSAIFNYGRNEVRSFLLSSALFWLDRFHADALRVDAVASMLYLDYSRREGEWIPNAQGGRENLGAIDFLRRLNEAVYRDFPDAQTIAEESTAWPMVSRPTTAGGLGFGYKWDMGWMHDTLSYLSREPVHRKWHHQKLSFRMLYSWNENFMLPLSHDEVVHGKGSLIGRMPGDDWQRFANLRLLFAYQFGQPGKKLLFMGGEFGQRREWAVTQSLEWHVAGLPFHAGVRRWVADLNRAYRAERALHELDCEPAGFEWLECDDADHGVVAFLRRGRGGPEVAAAFNFTPVPRPGYRVALPADGFWREILNSDAREYDGSGVGNGGGVRAEQVPWKGRAHSAPITIPPLGAVFLRREEGP
jgi:1,4-alpha-glucan branching enzyme